jgi:hypothetical protein
MDCAFARNPKILALISERDGYRAAFVWTAALGYSNEQGTDGYVPKSALGLLHGRPRDAQLLTAYRLWHESNGGWQVNGWAEFQFSTAENKARSESARHAACTRWHGKDCDCWKESG